MQYDEQKAMDTIINQGYLVNGYPVDDYELEAFRSGDDFFFRNWILYNECVSEVKRALEECEQLKAIINVDKVLRESDGLTLDDFAAELALRTWAYYWDGMNECGLLEQIAKEHKETKGENKTMRRTNKTVKTTNNNENKKGDATMKTTNKTGHDISKFADAMRIREASGKVVFHAPRGNDKTGIIPCWNLLPVVTCAGLCPGCYAVKNVFRCGYNVETSSVLKAWTDNTILAKTDLEGLYDKLDEYFSSMAAPRYFRIHASGDFFSKEYAEMWYKIAKNHPETRFLAFTKQFDNIRDIPFDQLDNFSLVLSAWPGKPIPEDLREIYSVAWMQDGTETRIPEKVFECPGNCQTCGACWGLAKDKRDVCFHKH